MSEKSQEMLLSLINEPPETDSDEKEIDQRYDKAIYESNKADILVNIGKNDFKYVWLVSKEEIKFNSEKRQSIFAQQVLDKISEVYDFKFPDDLTLSTQLEIDEFYNFMEFLEFNNFRFLSYVWGILHSNLINLDIENYCKDNADKIIKEVEEQLDVHPQEKLVSIFLKTFYRDGFIKWFIKNTNRNLIEIQVGIKS